MKKNNFFKNINNIENTIYFDIVVNITILIILILSLNLSSFSIIPTNITKPFIGINQLMDIFESLHYILIGISLVFIVQSIILLKEYKINNITDKTIIKLLFYRWLFLTINNSIPFVFNLKVSPIFIILSIFVLFFFWYKTLINN
tara:strand:+ start:1608 stop:2042 length:435 start_codon:yes stop_codon:yes gene_type:complete